MLKRFNIARTWRKYDVGCLCSHRRQNQFLNPYFARIFCPPPQQSTKFQCRAQVRHFLLQNQLLGLCRRGSTITSIRHGPHPAKSPGSFHRESMTSAIPFILYRARSSQLQKHVCRQAFHKALSGSFLLFCLCTSTLGCVTRKYHCVTSRLYSLQFYVEEVRRYLTQVSVYSPQDDDSSSGHSPHRTAVVATAAS